MFKKLLALGAGLIVTLAAYAATPQLRPDHPQTYVVQKGDTLWSISAQFLEKPWLWPEIWDINSQVFNPHRIYPGDVLQLGADGLKVIAHAEPPPEPTVASAPIPTIPLAAIRPFLKDYRVLSASELKRTPYVVGLEESEPRAVEGMNLYVRQLDGASQGQRLAVVRPTHVFREFGSDVVAHIADSNVHMASGPWREDFRGDGHLRRGSELGVEVRVIGTVQVQKTGKLATVLLTNASMEIRAGDRLLPVDDAPYDYAYYPHPPQSIPEDARVIALANDFDANSVAGPTQVIALGIGSKDGVDNGSTFAIYQPGDKIPDLVRGHTDRRMFAPKVQLPEEFVGHVLVFRTFERVSYALVMDGIRPVHMYNTVRAPL